MKTIKLLKVIPGVVGLLGSAVLAGGAVIGRLIWKDKKKESDERIRRASRGQEELRSPENRLFAGWSQIDQLKYFKAVTSNK